MTAREVTALTESQRHSIDALLSRTGATNPAYVRARIEDILAKSQAVTITCARCGRTMLPEAVNTPDNSAMEVCATCTAEMFPRLVKRANVHLGATMAVTGVLRTVTIEQNDGTLLPRNKLDVTLRVTLED